MPKRWLMLCSLVVAALVVGFGASRISATIARPLPSLIRFHVLANSDAPQDQQLKYQVRDAVVAYLTPKMQEVTTYDQAYAVIGQEREAIAAVAKQAVAAAGADYPVAVQLGYFEFPVKTYGTLTLPSGTYQALRIVIGRGEGQNWWCVLFPPLCFISGSIAAPVPDGQTDGVPHLRWKIVEMLEQQGNNL